MWLNLFKTGVLTVFAVACSGPAQLQTVSIIENAMTKIPVLHQPRIVIEKRKRLLEVYDGDRLVKSYGVVFGFSPEGDKEKEGDGKTPEGEFYIFTKNPQSKFHLGLGISYPSTEDAERGFADGMITKRERDEIIKAIKAKKIPPQKTALGGEVYIHGGGVARDWTWGCIAMKDEDIEEIYNAIDVGTPVLILP